MFTIHEGNSPKISATCIKDQEQEFVASSVIHQIQENGNGMTAILRKSTLVETEIKL